MRSLSIQNVAFLGRSIASAFFTSLYESFSPLTGIINQHFVEWFSGDALDSIWTFTNIAGTGSGAMSDEIDGGFSILTASTVDSDQLISFNNKRQYDPANSELISVLKRVNTDCILDCGLKNDTAIGASPPNSIFMRNDTSQTFIIISSHDGTTGTILATDIPIHTNWTTMKLVNSASDLKLYLDGILKATKTTNRPTLKSQPYFEAYNRSGGATRDVRIRYLECYNTTVPILSSLYERLYPLTSLAKQRVVEWFSGGTLDERWTFTNIAGTGSGAISDEIDGGYSILSGAVGDNSSAINFNNKRQYDHQNSVIITVGKRAVAGTIAIFGLSGDNTMSANFTVTDDRNDLTFKRLTTKDATTETSTNTDVAVDTNYHTYKIECTSTNNKLYIDGILKVTKTTNLPTAKMMPLVRSYALGAQAGETRIRYLECYNTLAGFTYESVYEMFQSLTTIAKTRFVEWFSGNALKSIWTVTLGSGTSGMDDNIDGGYIITTAGTSNNTIDFGNNHRQYSPTASIVIGVTKVTNFVDNHNHFFVGLCGASNVNTESCVMGQASNVSSFYVLDTADATTRSRTDSDVAEDTNWHNHKAELGTSNIKYYIDGVLKVTKTTNRPTTKLEPSFEVQRVVAGAEFSGHIRYLEAKNV